MLHRVPIRFLLAMPLCVASMTAVSQVPNAPQAGEADSFRIAGVVESKIDGHPLAGARVTIRDARNPRKFGSVVTSEDGKFAFSALPAGKYSLTGSKRGFVSSAYDQHEQFSTAIVTGAGLDTESLVLKLAPGAIITGKVLDEAGEPVRSALVSLYVQTHDEGVDQVRRFRGGETDDQGVFEMTKLVPGTYFLSVSARPWYAVHPPLERRADHVPADNSSGFDRSLDVAYPTTYYADATEADSATPIPVRGGERLEVDFHLNPVPALRILVRGPHDGNDQPLFPRLEQSTFDGTSFVQSNGTPLPNGEWELFGVPAGHYNIRIQGAGSTGLQMDGIDLSKDGDEIDTSKAEAMSSVKIVAQIPGESALPPQLAVGLRSGNRTMTNWRRFDAKGEADLPPIPAGRYGLLILGSAKPYGISHLSVDGVEVPGHTLVVKPGSSPLVSITLTSGSAELEGIVKRAGKPVAGAMVVLVPKNPEGSREVYRRDQSDLDGTFSLRAVIPGSYTIVALENGWDLDWSQPEVIGIYAKHGRAVEVVNQPGRPMTLTEPVELQSK
jgi:hypothetical protein